MWDPEGTQRIADWIPARGGWILGHTHLPQRQATAGVVICSPLFVERGFNQRAEVLLACALTKLGLAVQRFDYRGSGDSEGDLRCLTLESAKEDCLLATDRLRRRAGVQTVGIAGTRWGALVAASGARPAQANAIALWEAKLDGRSYFEELLQTLGFHDLWSGRRYVEGLHRRRLESRQPVDLMGWRIEPDMFESSVTRSVAGQMASCPVPTLLVHANGSRHDSRLLERELVEVGCKVEVSSIDAWATWWWAPNRLIDPGAAPPVLEAAVPGTAAWFKQQLVK